MDSGKFRMAPSGGNTWGSLGIVPFGGVRNACKMIDASDRSYLRMSLMFIGVGSSIGSGGSL